MHQVSNRRQFLWLSASTTLLIAGCGRRGSSAPQAWTPPPAPPQRVVTPVVAAPAAPSGMWYQVESGDTLAAIGRRSGLAPTQIRSANKLSSNLIKPGQRLWLPGAATIDTDPLAASAALPVLSGGFRLVPRSSWTKSQIRANHRKMGTVNKLTIHHTGDHKGMRGKSDRDIVRMIDRYHRQERKWSSIGYHYIIGREGDVFEGRPEHIQGAHVSSANSKNIGISVIGDFNKQLPNQRQLSALAAFVDDRRRAHGISRSRVYGHRDLGKTVCPGDKLHAWLKQWKRA